MAQPAGATHIQAKARRSAKSSELRQLFTDSANFYTTIRCCCCFCVLARCPCEIFSSIFANGQRQRQPQRKSLYWIILQNLRGIKSGKRVCLARHPMPLDAKGLSTRWATNERPKQNKNKNTATQRKRRKKTFIYILKVDASISPKSISVPHIFGALPTYRTFKVYATSQPFAHSPAAAKSVRKNTHTPKTKQQQKKKEKVKNTKGISASWSTAKKTRIQFGKCRKKKEKFVEQNTWSFFL